MIQKQFCGRENEINGLNILFKCRYNTLISNFKSTNWHLSSLLLRARMACDMDSWRKKFMFVYIKVKESIRRFQTNIFTVRNCK